ncbi:MAG: 50S ribosomal protein L9 [Gammaproteobacteria bacterium]|nr:50S ribosomal protein L9 [Gammaproteobacteria bacterium]MDJ0893183.1 50S ribosomal protein L9 [Gammaproteobacteria bacterium]
MQVILLEKVQNLGELGDKVTVRPGYGRNYLIPKGKAVAATEDNLAEFERRRAELEKTQADALGKAEQRAGALKEVSVSISRKAGEEGKLFGSVGTGDIAEAVTAAGVELHKHEVRLPEGPLRQAGEYDIVLHLHADVDASVKVVVVPED